MTRVRIFGHGGATISMGFKRNGPLLMFEIHEVKLPFMLETKCTLGIIGPIWVGYSLDQDPKLLTQPTCLAHDA